MIVTEKVNRNDEQAAQIIRWLAQDALHQANGITIEDVFKDGTETVVIHDEAGPLMGVRLHLALRPAIQFSPNSRIRTAKVGVEVVEWFKKLAVERDCNEIIVRPGGKARNFAEKLGFTPFDGQFIEV